MQAAPLSRPEEVTMSTRRIVAGVCALALAVPAVASARPGFDPPVKTTDHVVYGDTKYDLQNKQDLATKGVVGDTKNDVVQPAGRGVGAIASLNEKRHSPVASADDEINGWRIAAVAEAGVLAAIALGAAMLVARARPRRSAAA